MSKCFWLSIWYTLRYGLAEGAIMSGHDFEATGEVHGDHWVLMCKRCGQKAGTEQL
jgi:hypothetical protein